MWRPRLAIELNKDTTRGFVMGAGVDLKVLVIHLSPEVRFTRWGPSTSSTRPA